MKTDIIYTKHHWLMYVLLMSILIGATVTNALEIGEPAPDFTLMSTTGKTISLSQFKGKKNVLLQFYSMDFNPS